MKTFIIILALATSTIVSFGQGSLTPPGSPGPTMKTLDQVEPRTPIDVSHTSGDGDYEFIITQPGSYYLTGNLTTTKTNGINVTVADVTIDLNGFEVSRAAGPFAVGDGIHLQAVADGCTIRNGSISGFSSGVGAV